MEAELTNRQNFLTSRKEKRRPNRAAFDHSVKEPLMKSGCADWQADFCLARKKNAGILTDFKIF